MADEPFALMIPAPPATDAEYDAICATVMESGRGRWFLAEYARRNRHADTKVLLAALDRIEAVIRGGQASEGHGDEALAAPAEAARAPLRPPGDETDHSTAPRNIAKALEDATAAIRSASERLQDVAWHLRERQYDDKFCDEIEARTAEISRACVVLDVAAAAAHDIATLIATPGRAETAPSADAPQTPAPVQTFASASETPPEALEIPWDFAAAPSARDALGEPASTGSPGASVFETEATPEISLWRLEGSDDAGAQADATAASIDEAPPPAAATIVAAEPPAAAAPAKPSKPVVPAAEEPDAQPRGGWLSNLLMSRMARSAPDEDDAPAPKAAAEPPAPTPESSTAPAEVAAVSPPVRAAAAVAEAPRPMPAPAPVLVPAAAPRMPDTVVAMPEPDAAPVRMTIEAPPPAIVEVVVVETRAVPIDAPAMATLVVASATVTATAAETPNDDDPADFLLEPLPPLSLAATGPAPQPAKPRDPFAPIRALSEEEKIALFS